MAGKTHLIMAVFFLLIIGAGLVTMAAPMSIVRWVEVDGIPGLTAEDMEEPTFNLFTLSYIPRDDQLINAWKGYDIEMVKTYPNYFAGMVVVEVLASLGFIYSVRNMVKERAHEEAAAGVHSGRPDGDHLG